MVQQYGGLSSAYRKEQYTLLKGILLSGAVYTEIEWRVSDEERGQESDGVMLTVECQDACRHSNISNL